MTMQLCDIFDASEDSLQQAAAAVRSQPVSAEQQCADHLLRLHWPVERTLLHVMFVFCGHVSF